MLAVLVCLAACAKPEEETEDGPSAEVTVTSIEVVEGTTPAQVNLDAIPDFSGIQVKVNYSDGTSKTVGFADVTVGAVDTSEVGMKTVKVTYQSVSTTFRIAVVDPEATAYVIGIDANIAVEDTNCYVFDELKLDTLQVIAIYSTGREEILNKDQYTLSTVDTTVAGEKTMTVTYNADPTMTDTVKFNVIGVKDITVITGTVASKIKVGQTLDVAGIQVLVTYTNDVTADKEYKDLTVGTIDTSTAGVKQLTVTYKDKTIEFPVEVIAPDHIEINKGSYPEKVKIGDAYAAPELKGWLYYTDGTTKDELNASNITCTVDTTKVGDQQLVFSHAGLTATATVEVVGASQIQVQSGIKKEMLKGEAFDISGLQVYASYTDGTNETLSASALKIDGTIDTSKPGEQTISITYLDKTITYTVKICTVVAIRADKENTVIQAGDPISVDDIAVYGIFDDEKGSEVLLETGITTNVDTLDKDSEENKTLTVTYTGEWGTFTDDIIITTTPPDLVSIEITAYDKYVELGGDYDESSVTVFANFDNNTRKKVTATITDVVTTAAGNAVLKATYTFNGKTEETTVNVTVLPVSSTTVRGVATQVKKGETLDASGIEVTVTFSTEGFEPIIRTFRIADGVVVGTANTGTVGKGYLDVSIPGVVEYQYVYDIIGISKIEFFDADFDTVRDGHAVDFDNIMIKVTYTDVAGNVKAEEQKKLSDIKGITTKEESVANGVKITITHEDAGTIERELKIIKLQYIHAITGSIPPSIFQGQELDLSDMKVAFVYDNGDTYLVSVKEDAAITHNDIDPTKVGDQHIDITYTDAKGVKYKTTVIVTVKGVSKVEIVPGTVRTVIYTGSDKYDVSGLLVKVTYTDGAVTYVRLTDENTKLKIAEWPSSAQVGKTKLVVSYMGKTGEIEIEVRDKAEVEGNTGFIFGTLKPDELVARESYKNNFRDGSSPYYVGDDNKFYFYLNVVILDENYNIIETDGRTERTTVNVYKDGELLSDYSAYVAFNPADNSYDFTEAAIGSTFTLEIRPEDPSRYDPSNPDIVKTHTVKVVDGYNVYEAWELNMMTNSSHDITQECFGSENSVTQVAAVDRFLATKGVSRPDRLASIVLHCNLDVGEEDLPSEYFYIDSKGVNQGLFDHVGLFRRDLRPEEKSFSIYGNYFSVYSYDVPCVTPKGVANNDDDYSSSDLFRIRLTSAAHDEIATKKTKQAFRDYVVNIRDIATRDDDPNSNDQSASERHMRGLVCYKVGETTINMTNVNIDAYMTSVIVENMGSELNLNKVRFYNSWQGHLFLWSLNEHQQDRGGEQEVTWDYIPNLDVNIVDSSLSKNGGPVILAQAPHVNYAMERNCGVVVKADAASEISTYVTGQEAWFVAVGQTQMAAQIRAMSPLIGKALGNNAFGFVTTNKIQGVETINMMMVAMGNAGMGFDGAGMCNASFEKDGVMIMQSHHDNNTTSFQNLALDYAANTIYQQSGRWAPIFQTSGGGLAYTDGTMVGPLNEQIATGDHITLYYKDLGACIAMEYYHP